MSEQTLEERVWALEAKAEMLGRELADLREAVEDTLADLVARVTELERWRGAK